MRTTHPRATRCVGGAVLLTFPWVEHTTPGLVARLKAQIPASSRTYDPATKIWTVGPAWADHAIHLLRQAFPEARVLDAAGYTRTAPPPRPPLATERHFAALGILPTCPPPVVNAVYRAWVKLCHPDALPAPERDGATRRIQELNAVFEALKSDGRA